MCSIIDILTYLPTMYVGRCYRIYGTKQYLRYLLVQDQSDRAESIEPGQLNKLTEDAHHQLRIMGLKRYNIHLFFALSSRN